MRRTLIALIAVVAVAVTLCAFSQAQVRKTAEEMDLLRVRAAELVRAGDDARAMECLTDFAMRWQKSTPLLEMLTSHDDLHEVAAQLVDAQVCLENGDMDDCLRTLAQLGEALRHIEDMEALTLSNLY